MGRNDNGLRIKHSVRLNLSDAICVRVPIPLLVISGAYAFYNMVIIAVLCYMGVLNFRHYTYWNYVIITVFDIFYVSSSMLNISQLFKWVNLVFLPAVLGSTAIVNILIIVILYNDDWIMVSASVFGDGRLPIGKIHLMDYMVHSLPLFVRLILLALGQLDVLRYIVGHYMRQNICLWRRTSLRSLKYPYFIYWVFCPLLLIGTYSLFNNPFQEYPTSYSFAEGIAMLLGICILFQSLIFLGVHSVRIKCKGCGRNFPHYFMQCECRITSVSTSFSKPQNL